MNWSASAIALVFQLIPASVFCATPPASAPLGPSLVGIDHIPVAVVNLERASQAYRALGFTLKPGRFHEDGIRNNHVKFPDGSGIELISPPVRAVDDLTAEYVAQVAAGDGPAHLSLHARDTDQLVAALQSGAIGFHQEDFTTPTDPNLKFLFFDQDNRSPTDRPEYFVHPNTAIAMTAVWLALDEPGTRTLAKLLLALGAVMQTQTVFVPSAATAPVWKVQNGSIVLLPKTRQSLPGRPIVGVEFEVRDLGVARRYAGSAGSTSRAGSGKNASKRLFVPPSRASGLWLEFHEG